MVNKVVSLQGFYAKIKAYLTDIWTFGIFFSNTSGNPGQSEQYYPSVLLKITKFMLPWRWLLMALLGLSVFIGEAEEHLPQSVQLTTLLLEFDFIREILVYGLIFPLIGGIILEILNRIQADQRHVTGHLHRQQEFNQRLMGILEWDELAHLLVRFPRTIAPFSGIFLLVYNQDRTRLELVAEWRDSDSQAVPLVLPTSPDFCQTCAFVHSFSMNSLAPCHCPDNPAVSQQNNYYCLPLVHGTLPAALLHFYLPPKMVLTTYQVALLNGLAPSMALALENLQPQRLVAQIEATEAERRRIARHLHDSLGQHLGYLRLKLDHLTGDAALWEIAGMKQDLERMRDIANEAYEQVRGTLATLRPSNTIDLAVALLTQAEAMSQQGQFTVILTSQGEPRALSPLVQQQVLYLFQEALTNIARHAQAQRVTIDLSWSETVLTVKLSDDGQGFDPAVIQLEGHFGLAIMHERAREINGRLTVTSELTIGTDLILSLPLD